MQSSAAAAGTGRLRRKLVVVGDGSCGKTCLLIAYTQDDFPETYIPTVFETYITDIKVDGQIVQFALWDTAGQEEYEQLRPLSYPNTDVILVCFAIDNRHSFANVTHNWVREVRHFCPRTPIVLVATKIDLRSDPSAPVIGGRQKVSAAEGAELSSVAGACKYVECSAKTREGIQDVFLTAARVAISPSKPGGRKLPFCLLL